MSKILLVEDDMILALTLKNKLEQLGHVVLEVQSEGIGAISEVLNNNPDLIIMDIKLIGSIDGIETMIEIRKFSSIPVIYVSGALNESMQVRTKETIQSEFMSKPLDIFELEERISSALKKIK